MNRSLSVMSPNAVNAASREGNAYIGFLPGASKDKSCLMARFSYVAPVVFTDTWSLIFVSEG